MIILGIILLLIGLFAKIAILWTIGIVLVLIGLILMAFGSWVVPWEAGATTTDARTIRVADHKEARSSAQVIAATSR